MSEPFALSRNASTVCLGLLLVVLFGTGPEPALGAGGRPPAQSAGSAPAAEAPPTPTRDYSQGPRWFPHFLQPYTRQAVPQPNLGNTPRLSQMIHDGKLKLSVANLVAAVEENNLDVAVARYPTYIAETDILRARSGQALRGVEGIPIPGGLFSGALGAGIGQAQGLNTSGTGGAAISGSARQLSLGPRGTFDPTVILNLSFDRSSSPLNTVRVAGVPLVSAPTTAVLFRYEQAFTTGTSFSLTFNNQRQSSTQQFLLFNPAFSSRLSISVVQHLMNGFGFAVNRRFQDVGRNNLEISREQFRQQLIATLTSAQNRYWDLAAAQENVRLAQHSLEVAQQLQEDNQKRSQAGTLAEIDVLAAESEVAARRRDLIVAQTALQLREEALKNHISKQRDRALETAHIQATDALPEPQAADIPPLREALETAMRNRPELKVAQDNTRNFEITARFTRDNLKPTLDAFGLFAGAGLAGNLVSAFRHVRGFDLPEYGVGFTLTIPLKNRSAQADNVRARLELEQAEASTQRTFQQIGLEVRNAVAALVEARAQVEAARRAVESSREAFEGEQKKMTLGASTPYAVILVQRDLISAQLAEVEARAAHAKARAELDRTMGTTLETHKISLEDALEGRIPQRPAWP